MEKLSGKVHQDQVGKITKAELPHHIDKSTSFSLSQIHVSVRIEPRDDEVGSRDPPGSRISVYHNGGEVEHRVQ